MNEGTGREGVGGGGGGEGEGKGEKRSSLPHKPRCMHATVSKEVLRGGRWRAKCGGLAGKRRPVGVLGRGVKAAPFERSFNGFVV